MKTIQELEYKGKTYPVWYRHERDYKRYHPYTEKLIIAGRTVAFIRLNDTQVIEAYAECSVLDYYNKSLGREIAGGRLARAVRDPVYLKEKMAMSPSKVAKISVPFVAKRE